MKTQILLQKASTTFVAALLAGAAIVTAGLVCADEKAYTQQHAMKAQPLPTQAKDRVAPVQLEPIEVVGHKAQKVAAAEPVVLPSIEIVGHASEMRFA